MDHLQQVTSKLSAYYTEDEQFPDCVYLFGQKSVGKSFCLQKFLESSSEWVQSVVIHASECYVNKILFETIINSFKGYELSHENNYAPYAKIDSIEDFLSQLKSLDSEGSYLIAIENAEKLRDMEHNIIPVLTKLQEFTGLNISCIFVSHLAIEKFAFPPMIKIHVPDFNKNDLIEIFTNNYDQIHEKIVKAIRMDSTTGDVEKEKQLQIADKLDKEFYKSYLNIFLNVFYKACRDITELQFLANKCYKGYYAPVLSGDIKFNDATNLWRNITKLLKMSLSASHMRIENLSAAEMMNEELLIECTKENPNSVRNFAQTLELPYYAKYLLIASFLASHNDAKFDKRLFMKHHGKERKRQKKAKVTEKLNVQFGPKSFNIDRLLAIFYAILDEKVGLTCNLLSQISTLVDLKLLTFVSGENNIMEGNSRLQSTIGMEFAINIGKVVGFNVKQYLTDFH